MAITPRQNIGQDGERAFPLYRISIGRRLTLCFAFIFILMLASNAFLLWRLHLVRVQADRLMAVDQELIAVLRFQTSLRNFHDRLNELAQSNDSAQLLAESESLRSSLLEDAKRTQASVEGLPSDGKLEPPVMATLESVESSLPSHLDAIRALAVSGDWVALRVRLANQIQPLEFLSSELVKEVDQEVATERAHTALSIRRAERQMLFIVPATGLLALLIAAILGAVITRSITRPLGRVMAGSRALSRGEFHHQISIEGTDELAHLGLAFNHTAEKLQELYQNLRSRKEQIRESEKELRQLIDFVPAHVFVLRPDGEGLYANQVILDYYGFTLEEWMAPGLLSKVVHPDDLEHYLGQRRVGFASLEPFEAEGRIRRKDGQYRWFLTRFNPMKDESGHLLRWYVVRTDIEENKQSSERTRNENLALREEVVRSSMFEEIVGSSEKLLKVLSEVERVASADSTVLILGETGTGKELVARAIHKQSNRAGRAFIRVNCAAIPASLISSELFGHEKGAFTGAIQRRLGRFESADGGTIFLDEIGDLPIDTQIVLLRVLQEREFERVGSNQAISVDVRILAATNRNLNAAVASGNFRQDLFYRLNVFPVHIPPLRERAEDIPLLLEYLIERYAKKSGKKIRQIRKRTLELFQAYDWPGNIRELQNVVERAVLLCDDDTFSVDETWLKQEVRRETGPTGVALRGLGRLDVDQERRLIEATLAETKGRVSGPAGAAAKLGIPRQTLESKIASLGINRNRFQN
ncbi:MAG TPA: sigma 54-interacting transcriptional regulator [Candidatus Acidoferrum sp.]|nr:sigma 54-interacting transcriptional regulator [Candidatus Acidoferrum sp.]